MIRQCFKVASLFFTKVGKLMPLISGRGVSDSHTSNSISTANWPCCLFSLSRFLFAQVFCSAAQRQAGKAVSLLVRLWSNLSWRRKTDGWQHCQPDAPPLRRAQRAIHRFATQGKRDHQVMARHQNTGCFEHYLLGWGSDLHGFAPRPMY